MVAAEKVSVLLPVVPGSSAKLLVAENPQEHPPGGMLPGAVVESFAASAVK